MANWKSKFTAAPAGGNVRPFRRPNSGALGFVPIVPSADPVSTAVNVALTAFAIGSELLSHSGSAEADDLVQRYQNPLQNALGVISDRFTAAIEAGTATAAQLHAWAAQVKQLGDQFEKITTYYPNKGPGARRTIFGVKNPAGIWEQQPPAAPGYLTGLLNNILNHAREADAMLGNSWTDLLGQGIHVIDDIFANNDPYGPGYPYDPGINPGPGGTYPTRGGMLDFLYEPSGQISTQTLVIGGLLLFFVAPKLLKAFK